MARYKISDRFGNELIINEFSDFKVQMHIVRMLYRGNSPGAENKKKWYAHVLKIEKATNDGFKFAWHQRVGVIFKPQLLEA